MRREQPVQVRGGPPGVERAADGRLAEPVHGGAAGRLDVRRHVQFLGQFDHQRAGGDGGQVRLQQHVVQGNREQRRERFGGPDQLAGQQGAPRTSDGAAPGDTQQLGLDQRAVDQFGAQPRGADRAVPREVGEQVGGGRGGAGRQLGQPAEQRMAHLGGRGAVDARAEGVDRSVLVVAGADQAGHARGLQPDPGQGRPALRHGPGPPHVVGGSGQPLLVGFPVARDQAGGVRQLQPGRGLGLGDVEGAATRLRSRTPRPPHAARAARRCSTVRAVPRRAARR